MKVFAHPNWFYWVKEKKTNIFSAKVLLNTQIVRLDYWRLQRLFTKENLHFSLKSTKTLLASVLHINYLLISPRGFFWFRCAERATSRNKVLNTLRNWLASSKQFNLSLLSVCSADVKRLDGEIKDTYRGYLNCF